MILPSLSKVRRRQVTKTERPHFTIGKFHTSSFTLIIKIYRDFIVRKSFCLIFIFVIFTHYFIMVTLEFTLLLGIVTRSY